MAANDIPWEPDPKVFIFHNESQGKNKMHVRMLDLFDKERGWVMIDESYREQMALRKTLIDNALSDFADGDKTQDVYVSNTDSWCTEAKWELFDMLIPYLLERFPYIFEKRGDCMYNKALDEYIPLARDPTLEDPLIRASRLTQQDWCLMQESESEAGYILAAGVVCFPMRWSLKAKFNVVMGAIHEPVESFTKHLKPKVYSVMKNLKPEKPIWRANWAVFNDLKGPLDLWAPMASADKNEQQGDNKTQYGRTTGTDLVFRAEYQTLRKLPKSRAIVFSIRTYQRYLSDFKNHPHSDAQGLINAINWMDEDNSLYKSAQNWRDAAVRYLEVDVMGKGRGLTRDSWAMVAGICLAVAVAAMAIAQQQR